MTSDFDPYYKWLGIPPKDQPPHHYRLLGIELFETDREVIDAAANRLMGYLKDLAVGDEGAHSQQLLNEIARARLCLLNKKRKAAYDDQLREKLKSEGVLESKARKPSAKGPPPKALRSVPPPAAPPSAAMPPTTAEPPSSPKPPGAPAPPFDPVKVALLDKPLPKPEVADPVKIAIHPNEGKDVEPAVVKDLPVQPRRQGRGVFVAAVLISIVGGLGLVLIVIMSLLLLTSRGGPSSLRDPEAAEAAQDAALVLELTDRQRDEVTEFLLDDVRQPLPPALRHVLEPGRHIIRLKRRGYKEYYNSITLIDGRSTPCAPQWQRVGADASR